MVMVFSMFVGVVLAVVQLKGLFTLWEDIRSEGVWKTIENLSLDADPSVGAYLDLSYSSYLTTELLNLYSLGVYSEDTVATVFLAAISLPLLWVWLRKQMHMGFVSAFAILGLAMWSNQNSPELVVLTCVLVAVSLVFLVVREGRWERWKEWASLLVYQALPLVIQVGVITLDDTSSVLGCLVILGVVASGVLRVRNKAPTLRVVMVEFVCVSLSQTLLMAQVLRLQVSGICQSSPIAFLDTVVNSLYLPVGVVWTALQLKALYVAGETQPQAVLPKVVLPEIEDQPEVVLPEQGKEAAFTPVAAPNQPAQTVPPEQKKKSGMTLQFSITTAEKLQQKMTAAVLPEQEEETGVGNVNRGEDATIEQDNPMLSRQSFHAADAVTGEKGLRFKKCNEERGCGNDAYFKCNCDTLLCKSHANVCAQCRVATCSKPECAHTH